MPVFRFWCVRLRKLTTRVLICIAVGCYLAILVACCLLSVVLHGVTAIWAVYDLPLYRLPEFVLGIILACLVQRGIRIPVRRSIAVGFLILSFIAIDIANGLHLFGANPAPLALMFLPAVCAALMVYGGSDATGQDSIMRKRFMVRLGEWSFAMYLIHWPLLMIVRREQGRHSVGIGLAYEVMFVTAVIVLSALAYVAYERPIERWLRRLRHPSGAHRVGRPAQLSTPASAAAERSTKEVRLANQAANG
jgi:peptidoglycan/LPS O-acetylase OafA/YrhL